MRTPYRLGSEAGFLGRKLVPSNQRYLILPRQVD
jgi:hypothetical protein